MKALVTKHLPLVAGAPDGIEKLRGLILDLAIQGKLVAQNANEETSSKLLAQIDSVKGDYLRKSELARFNSLAGDTTDICKYTLPKTWSWRRLGALGLVGSSSRVHQKDWQTSGVPFYRTREIVQLARKGAVDPELFISEDLYLELTSSGPVPVEGDIMITGVGTIGVPYIVREGERFYFKDASVLIFKNYFRLNSEYLALVFSSPYWDQLIHQESMGTTVHTLTIGRACAIPIPLPPLAEQHRIVAKVDELMALCDRLEADQADAESAHAQLVQALLDSLTQATDATDFRASWQRLSEHFHTLFTTEASIDALKQAVLQLAVMGKLVPQSSSDEPASVLLRRIQSEGKGPRKAEIEVAPLEDDCGRPLSLPAGWSWLPFGSICSVQGNLVRPEDFMDSQQLAPDCIEKGTGRIIERRTVRQSGVRGPNSRFFSGQIVYSKIRPSLSKVVLVDFDGLCSADMYPINSYISPSYQLRLMLSEVFLRQVRLAENRVKMPKLNQESLSSFVLPIPPLAEQHRIVAKVDELMALCDQLKAQLSEARKHHEQLAQALVEQAIS